MSHDDRRWNRIRQSRHAVLNFFRVLIPPPSSSPSSPILRDVKTQTTFDVPQCQEQFSVIVSRTLISVSRRGWQKWVREKWQGRDSNVFKEKRPRAYEQTSSWIETLDWTSHASSKSDLKCHPATLPRLTLFDQLSQNFFTTNREVCVLDNTYWRLQGFHKQELS